MSSHLTDEATSAVVAVQTSDVRHQPQPRDAIMHAFAAAEDVIGTMKGGMPHSVDVKKTTAGAYEVRLYFSESSERIKEMATAYDVPVTVAPANDEDHIFTEARVTIRGVDVLGWTRTECTVGGAL